MEYKILNDKNRKYMMDGIKNNLNFEWEDSHLINQIIRKIDDIYPYSSDPQEFIDDKYYLNEINKLFKLLFNRKIDKIDFLNKLEKLFNEMLIKYPSLSYQYRYNINMYKEIISKSNRLIIKGCGGIGKSYFIYKLEETLSENNIDHLCVYGKYNDSISEIIYDEVKNKKKDFYFIIDALNEFEESEQQIILNNLKRIEKKKNITIIITYRTSSLKNNILEQLNRLLINEYNFEGVDFESSILKLIETYGVEIVRLIDVIESNNPLYLTMLNKILFNSKIKGEKLPSVAQMTFIMESYIKEICGLENWKFVKKIGSYMFNNNKISITEDELKKITGNKFDYFVENMIQNDFMGSYENNNNTVYFLFTIQRLSDYIIARSLFDFIKDKTEDEIIIIINEKLDKMYSMHEAFALVLLDKYKDKDINIALRIIFKSDIGKELNIEIFKKISFNNNQIKCIQEFIKYENVQNLFLLLGGYPNRPFNCKNYLNQKIIDDENIQKKLLVKFRESVYLIHLKNMVYILPFLEKETDILEEYFYYAFWLMSVPVERIRKLAIKVVYDISYKNKKYVNYLIDFYNKINELYIKKGIIHVLTKLSKSRKITSFIKSVYLNPEEIDAEIVYRTSVYLNKENEYQLLNKKNLNTIISSNIDVDSKLDLKQILFIADAYEKDLLKFDRSFHGNTLSLHNDFILNNNQEILKYNKELQQNFSCVKNNGYCKYSLGNSLFKNYMEPIEILTINPERMFILFQEIFKELCSIYKYDCYKKERFDIHLNKFEDSILKKILLMSQEILLGSLMTNYYTSEFYVYNDDKTFGYKNYSYLMLDEEQIYLTSPVSPYNELIDKLNSKICETVELYKNNNYRWFKSKKDSVDNCCKMIKPIIYDNNSWSLIGGDVHLFVTDFINVYYSCYMAFNPQEELLGNEDSRYLTIENKRYYGSVSDYQSEKCSKNMSIPNFESNSLDIKETNMAFPSPNLVKYLNLKYNFRTSSWDDINGNQIILCDNNAKSFYKYPVSGAIYIRTDILEELKKHNYVVYWCYTEKLYKNYGWNEKASLHLELDPKGNVIKEFNNNNLSHYEKKIPLKCKKCKYNIYKKQNEISNDYTIKIINDLLDDNEY